MASESKGHTFRIAGDVLDFSRFFGFRLAERGEAKGVVLFRVWVEGGIHGDGLCGQTDGGVRGDHETVGEGVVFCYYSLEGDWTQGLLLAKVSVGILATSNEHLLNRSGLCR